MMLDCFCFCSRYNVFHVLKNELPSWRTQRNSFSLIKDDYLYDHVLFTSGVAIYTLHLNSSKINLVAGGLKGYKEGVGSGAHFNQISVLVTGPNPDGSILWAAEYQKACIRAIDRRSQSTSTALGNCSTDQSSRTYSSPYSYITEIIKSPRPGINYYFASGQIDTFWIYRMEISVEQKVRLWTFRRVNAPPTGMTFDFNGEYMYVCEKNKIYKYMPSARQKNRFNPNYILLRETGVFVGLLLVNSYFLVTISRTTNSVQGIDLRTNSVIDICSTSGRDLVQIPCEAWTRRQINDVIKHPTKDNSILVGGGALYMLSGIQLSLLLYLHLFFYLSFPNIQLA